jgi:hypothetical protein
MEEKIRTVHGGIAAATVPLQSLDAIRDISSSQCIVTVM